MLKKIGFGAGAWLSLVVLVSAILSFISTTIVQQLLIIVAAAVVGYAFGFGYFKKLPGDAKTGAILGVIWAVITVVLDWIVIGIGLAANLAVGSFRDAYLSWHLYVALVVLIAAVAAAGQLTRGGELMKKPIGKPAESPFKPQNNPPQPPIDSAPQA